ncbi:hypothetical protein BGY98DRAFT_373419 [Russula aff. rugulosa BPL654]|nr:hypothetical protein BGY98DRAFT_373419 [Russula aff. rugulosa BPL654]
MQKTPTSTSSLPLSGKFSFVAHPPALLFQRITSLTPRTPNPLLPAKMLLLHSLPSIPNRVLAPPLDRCSRDPRPRWRLCNPLLLDARELLPHPFGTSFTAHTIPASAAISPTYYALPRYRSSPRSRERHGAENPFSARHPGFFSIASILTIR